MKIRNIVRIGKTNVEAHPWDLCIALVFYQEEGFSCLYFQLLATEWMFVTVDSSITLYQVLTRHLPTFSILATVFAKVSIIFAP